MGLGFPNLGLQDSVSTGGPFILNAFHAPLCALGTCRLMHEVRCSERTLFSSDFDFPCQSLRVESLVDMTFVTAHCFHSPRTCWASQTNGGRKNKADGNMLGSSGIYEGPLCPSRSSVSRKSLLSSAQWPLTTSCSISQAHVDSQAPRYSPHRRMCVSLEVNLCLRIVAS